MDKLLMYVLFEFSVFATLCVISIVKEKKYEKEKKHRYFDIYCINHNDNS